VSEETPEPSQPQPVDESAQKKKRTKKIVMLFVKLAILLVVLWCIRSTVVDAYNYLTEPGRASLFENFQWQWIAASGAFYLVGLAQAGLFWRFVLLQMGQPVGWVETFRAYFIGHLGKYVPGKAMVLVLRAGLLRGGKKHVGLIAAAVFFETLTMMAVGAFLASFVIALVLISGSVKLHNTNETFFILMAVGLTVASGLPTIPAFFKFAARKAGIGKRDPEAREKLDAVSAGTLLIGWGAMFVCWIFLALSLWAVFQSLGIPCPLEQGFHLLLAAVALAMVAGFLSLIPGGLFVREAVLLALLVPYLSNIYPDKTEAASVALVAAVLLRLVWLGAELLVSAVLAPIRRRAE